MIREGKGGRGGWRKKRMNHDKMAAMIGEDELMNVG